MGDVGFTIHHWGIIAFGLLLGNPCTTYPPLHRLVTIVDHDVAPVAVLRDKGLATNLTHERLLLTVNEQMTLEFVLSSKGFTAHFTFKGLLPCVNHKVLSKVRLPNKAFAT